MGKLMLYREFTTEAEAAGYLTKQWGESVTEGDVRELIDAGHLQAAVNLEYPVMAWEPGGKQRLGVVSGPHRLSGYTQRGTLGIQLPNGTIGEIWGAEVEHAMERRGLLSRDLFKFAEQAPKQPAPILTTTERRTLLTLIGVLCKHSGFNYEQRGITPALVKLTEKNGTPIGDDTIREILKAIPDAVESRKK